MILGKSTAVVRVPRMRLVVAPEDGRRCALWPWYHERRETLRETTEMRAWKDAPWQDKDNGGCSWSIREETRSQDEAGWIGCASETTRHRRGA